MITSFHSTTAKEWTKTFFGFVLKYCKKNNDGVTGRMGGGWNGNLGVQWSSSTWILNLGHSTLRISKVKP